MIGPRPKLKHQLSSEEIRKALCDALVPIASESRAGRGWKRLDYLPGDMRWRVSYSVESGTPGFVTTDTTDYSVMVNAMAVYNEIT